MSVADNQDEDAEKSPEAGPYEVLKNRDFSIYLAGRFIAAFGQAMATVAVGWDLYERTHSALALGFVGLTQMIPMFAFTLPAGHLADNYNRKKIIISMLGVMAVVNVGLAAASWTRAPVGWVYLCLFFAGTARTFTWPASSAFMPQLVSRANFARAVTWSSGTFHLSTVAGPAVGGAIIALTHSATPVFLLNAVAGLTCLGLMLTLRAKHAVAQREPMTLRSLAVGFRFVFENPVILGTITLDMFAVLLGGAASLLPVYAKDILHVGPSGLGLLEGALPAGSLLGSMIIAHMPPMQRAGRTLLWAVTGFGVATIVFGISRSFELSFAMLFLCGVTDSVSVVIRHTLVQLLTPDDKRGRVSAVNSLFIGTSNELGGFESGFLAHLKGPVFSVVAGGIGTILVVIGVASIWPQIRKYGRLDSPA